MNIAVKIFPLISVDMLNKLMINFKALHKCQSLSEAYPCSPRQSQHLALWRTCPFVLWCLILTWELEGKNDMWWLWVGPGTGSAEWMNEHVYTSPKNQSHGFHPTLVTKTTQSSILSCNSILSSQNFKNNNFPLFLSVWDSMARRMLKFIHSILVYIQPLKILVPFLFLFSISLFIHSFILYPCLISLWFCWRSLLFFSSSFLKLLVSPLLSMQLSFSSILTILHKLNASELIPGSSLWEDLVLVILQPALSFRPTRASCLWHPQHTLYALWTIWWYLWSLGGRTNNTAYMEGIQGCFCLKKVHLPNGGFSISEPWISLWTATLFLMPIQRLYLWSWGSCGVRDPYSCFRPCPFHACLCYSTF